MPTRRKVLAWGAAAAAAAPALAACAASPGAARQSQATRRRPGEKIKLVFWTWIPIQDLVGVWNKANPDVQVELQIVPASTSGGYQKMHAALQAGNPPDLAHVEYAILPEFMLVNGLTELSQYGADKLKDSYVDWQWNQGVFGGKVYTLPQASGPMALFHRKDLFDRWDIPVPATWDEFREAAVEVKKAGATICSFPPANAGWFASMAWQRGAHWIRTDQESDTWIVDIASEESLEVANFWDRMIRDELVIPMPDSQPPWFRLVQQSKIVTWVAAQWCDALLRANAPGTKGGWRVSDMPQWQPGENKASNWGGSSVAILQGSRYPVEAMEFAHWLNTDLKSIDMLIAAGYGWPGADVNFRKTALGKPDPFFGNQVYNEVFKKSDGNVDTSWQWAPTNTQSMAHVSDAFGAAIASGDTLVSALRDSQGLIVDDLKAKGLNARSA